MTKAPLEDSRGLSEVPGAGFEPARLSPSDFKSDVSTDFTTRAGHRQLDTPQWRGGSTGHVVSHGSLFPSRLSSPSPGRSGSQPLQVLRYGMLAIVDGRSRDDHGCAGRTHFGDVRAGDAAIDLQIGGTVSRTVEERADAGDSPEGLAAE